MTSPGHAPPALRSVKVPVGRKAEMEALLECLVRLRGGLPCVFLLSGEAGVGKTFLIRHMAGEAQGLGFAFGAGKFWPHSHNKPFEALFDSFAQAAGERPSAPVREKEPEREESPETAASRLSLAVKSAARKLARPEKPLVLFLDDLQWADRSSLGCLCDLATDHDLNHLLIIGAFRDQELSENHPLPETRSRMLALGARVIQVRLARLSFPDTLLMVSEATGQPKDRALALAEAAYRKTGGNPLFVRQFLLAAAADESLARLPEGKPGEKEPGPSGFLEEKLKALPEECRSALAVCSCAGPRFSPAAAARLLGESEARVAEILAPALSRDFLRREAAPEGGSPGDYSFSHDRVFQAAYGLLPPELAREKHGMLASDLARRLGAEPGLLLDCVYHYNQALPSITEPGDRLSVAELNLAAARRCRETAAFAPALDHLTRAMDCLPENPWQACRGLASDIYSLAAEAANLNGRFEQADQYADAALSNSWTLLEKIRVYRLLLQSQMATERFTEAVDLGLLAMKEMGFRFPSNPGKPRILWEYLKTSRLVKKYAQDQLAGIPEQDDPLSRAFLGLCFDTIPPAYMARPYLAPLLIFFAIRLFIKKGMTPQASPIFASYGMALSAFFRQPEEANRMGRLALTLNKRFRDERYASQTLYLTNFACLVWKEPLAERVAGLFESARIGRKTGAFSWASYAAFGKSYIALFSGAPLAALRSQVEETQEEVGLLGYVHTKTCTSILRQSILNLTTLQARPELLEGPAFSETRQGDLLPGPDRVLVRAVFGLTKAWLALLFRRPEAALAFCEMVLEVHESMMGSPPWVITQHCLCLACLDLAEGARGAQRRRLMKMLAKSEKELAFWAEHSPGNHGHRLLMVRAAKARRKGRREEAEKLFSDAARQAGKNGYIYDVALCRELFAEALLGFGDSLGARRELGRAREAYIAWGAAAKVQDLDSRHGELLASPDKPKLEVEP